MYHSRFQELMTTGYGLANKVYFKEFASDEFDQWIKDCGDLLSACEPEPPFPYCPDHRHIEEIVMLLSTTEGKISKGQIQYVSIL